MASSLYSESSPYVLATSLRALHAHTNILVICGVHHHQLSISGWLVSRYENLNNFESLAERDRVRYFLFVSAWTVLLTPIVMSLFTFARRSKASSVLVHLVLYVSYSSRVSNFVSLMFLSWFFSDLHLPIACSSLG